MVARPGFRYNMKGEVKSTAPMYADSRCVNSAWGNCLMCGQVEPYRDGEASEVGDSTERGFFAGNYPQAEFIE